MGPISLRQQLESQPDPVPGLATLYPDALIRIYLILPVKAKWLAVLYVVLTVYDLLRSGLWGALFTLPQLLAVWAGLSGILLGQNRRSSGEFGFAVRHQNSLRPSTSRLR